MMDPTTIGVIVAGVIAVIGSISGAVIAVIQAIRTSKKVDESKVVMDKMSGETDNQTKKLERIEILVDGRYGEVLQRLADVQLLLAKATGRASDQERADSAQKQSNQQLKRVEESNAQLRRDEDKTDKEPT